MKYIIEHLNGEIPIDVETIEFESVNVLLTDINGIKYGLPITIEDLNIDEKVLNALNEQYSV